MTRKNTTIYNEHVSFAVEPRSLCSPEHLAKLVGYAPINRLLDNALKLREELQKVSGKGGRILVINATDKGGGVAEMRHHTTTLKRQLGLNIDWLILNGDLDFFSVTTLIFEGLQNPAYPGLKQEEKEILELTWIKNFEILESKGYWKDTDLIWIDDPQPAGLIPLVKALYPTIKIIWRAHGGTATPSKEIANYISSIIAGRLANKTILSNYIKQRLRELNKGTPIPTWLVSNPNLAADISVFHTKEQSSGMNLRELFGIPEFTMKPAINPLSYKNMPLNKMMVDATMNKYSLDPNIATVGVVARFDMYKGPLEAIEAFCRLQDLLEKQKIDEKIQFFFAGNQALDNPKGTRILEIVQKYRKKLPKRYKKNIHVLDLSSTRGDGENEVDLSEAQEKALSQVFARQGLDKLSIKKKLRKLSGVDINALEVNALVTNLAEPSRNGCFHIMKVMLQPSSNEGTPLSVMEALFKPTLTVATDVGSIPEEIQHEETGLITHYTDEDKSDSWRNYWHVDSNIVTGKTAEIDWNTLRERVKKLNIIQQLAEQLYYAFTMDLKKVSKIRNNARNHVIHNFLLNVNVESMISVMRRVATKYGS